MKKDIEILVLGSINMDLVTETERNPLPGETIKSKSFKTSPGGKGDNQAVAIARLGGDVVFAGCVGNDQYGEQLIDNLIANGIEADYVKKLSDINTGMAFINVFKGQNTIILYEGANGCVTTENMMHCEELIKRSQILLMQLEIPVETIKWAAAVAEANETMVILNPAPALALDNEIYKYVDILVPNEVEAQQLSGIEIKNDSDYERIISRFRNMGVKEVIITLGDKGALYGNGSIMKRTPAYNVDAVDSTGAGDAFIGGLCFALSHDRPMDKALKYASAVAAISVTRMGAQSALPTAYEVEEFFSA